MKRPSRIVNGSLATDVFMGKEDFHADHQIPVVSHLEGNLWMGGVAHGLRLPYEILHIVSLHPWQRFAFHDEVKSFLAVVMHDEEEVPETGFIVDHVIGRLDDGPTLVHCHVGLNRAGLVCGQVLVAKGMTAVDAIALMREKRSPLVLCNRAFEQAVHDFEDALN